MWNYWKYVHTHSTKMDWLVIPVAPYYWDWTVCCINYLENQDGHHHRIRLFT
jgi:hypothetical protein